MPTRAIRPVTWPDTACHELWQRVRTAHFDNAPPEEIPMEMFCKDPRHAEHSALDESDARRCMNRGQGDCWMPDWGRGERPPPDRGVTPG